VLLTIDANEPEPWLVARVAQVLRRGGLAVVPTDTVYSIVCLISDGDAVTRLYEAKGISAAKRLSLLVPDIASAAAYTRGIPNQVFRIMRRALPGPYTLIFQASSEVPRIMLHKRRTVGLRIPDSAIVLALLTELQEPLLSTSVRNLSDEWVLDPVAIDTDYGEAVDVVVDGGLLAAEPSTVIDLSGDRPVLVREGKGDLGVLELID